MTNRSRQQVLTAEEIGRPFEGDWADRYPPILSVNQACNLLQIKRSTLYEWKAKGRLAGTFRKRGKHIRFWRDRLIENFFNEKEWR